MGRVCRHPITMSDEEHAALLADDRPLREIAIAFGLSQLNVELLQQGLPIPPPVPRPPPPRRDPSITTLTVAEWVAALRALAK